MDCILIEAKIQIICSNAQQPLIYSAFPVNIRAENIPNSSRAVQGVLFLFLLHQKSHAPAAGGEMTGSGL